MPPSLLEEEVLLDSGSSLEDLENANSIIEQTQPKLSAKLMDDPAPDTGFSIRIPKLPSGRHLFKKRTVLDRFK
jgi:hypothetical protein